MSTATEEKPPRRVVTGRGAFEGVERQAISNTSRGGNQALLDAIVSQWRIGSSPMLPVAEITLGDLLEQIRAGTHHKRISAYRSAIEIHGKDHDDAKALKKSLPAHTLSGRIEGGLKDAMIEGRMDHSGIIQLDLDGIEDPAKMRDELIHDPHVIAAWISPGGAGVKGIAAMSRVSSEEDHKLAFLAAEEYFKGQGLELDKACKNSNRLCYVSWDPDIKIRDGEIIEFQPIQPAPAKSKTATTRNAGFPEPPEHGIHDWLMRAAWYCRRSGMSQGETIDKLRSYEPTLRRKYQSNEVEDAVEKVFSVEEIPEDVFPIPAGSVTYTMAGDIIFKTMGDARMIFMRGDTVHEISRSDQSDHLRPVTPERFCGIVEAAGKRVARREIRKDGGEDLQVWRTSTFPTGHAKILLTTDSARKHLPPIRQIVNCPILTPDGEILGRGYHDHEGGTFVGSGGKIEEIMHGTAFHALRDLLVDFDFPTPSDFSRAFASLISPALKMGGWIQDDFPLDLAEADQSQSGKTFRQKIVARIYNETPSSITISKGGVGSLDEKISEALIKGRPFVTLGNIRGRIDSTILEEALRGAGRVSCRVLRDSAEVDTRPFLWQLSTNGAELTRDLANRAIVTRIRKQPEGHDWKRWPEGDLESHLIRNQSFYLSCVFSVIREWSRRNRPTTNESRHDFRTWCRALDGIVQMAKLSPLLDGHQAQQQRTANPHLQWLREVILATPARDYGARLFAHQLAEIAEDNEIPWPGNPYSKDEPNIRAGRILKRVFGDACTDQIEVDGFSFSRIEEPDFSDAGGGRMKKIYTIQKQ